MKTGKQYYTSVGSTSFKVNDEKTHIFFNNKWCELITESWGEIYFNFNGSLRYLDSGTIGTI